MKAKILTLKAQIQILKGTSTDLQRPFLFKKANRKKPLATKFCLNLVLAN